MAESSCCLGCSNVRKGAWIISIFNMSVCILLILGTISVLNFAPYKKNHSSRNGDFDSLNNLYDRHLLLENDTQTFCQLYLLFLFFYINLNLKRATYAHITQNIYQWLVVHAINFIFVFLFIGFATIKGVGQIVFPIGIPVIIVMFYQIYVVKCFYDDELKFFATAEQNIRNQANLHSPPIVNVNNTNIQAPPTYPVQSGPYFSQQLHQPLSSYSHAYMLPQAPVQPHIVLPPTQPQTIQEYTNPPPYSPNCNMQEGGTSVKQ